MSGSHGVIRKQIVRWVGPLTLSLGLLCRLHQTASGADFVVDNFTDTPQVGTTTLREAVE